MNLIRMNYLEHDIQSGINGILKGKPMRRKDREITDMKEILKIIGKCEVCRLALFDEEHPYIIPLNFGFSYEDERLKLYFHGAKEGKKLDLIKRNPKAAFEMDCSHELVTGPEACDYSMNYESVCGNGTITLLDQSNTEFALRRLMKQYTDDADLKFNEAHLNAVAVFELSVENITGKSRPPKK